MAASRSYDVFLSFSGIDTRNKFTGHLLDSLERHRFRTFRDDSKLRRGEEIGPGLVRAIEKSRISIVVFSKNYASSTWCLDELVKIMDCKRTLKQIVLPIFYDLQPSDVRSQRGCYAEAFSRHEKSFESESMERWRAALTDAANLSGYVLQNVANGSESKLIEIVVRDVGDKLNPTCLSVADYPVGIERGVQQVCEFLKLGSDSDVRIVAIWGMGGIGKTTIAKAMYNRIHYMFESSCFLANVGRTSIQPKGLVELQEKLLCDLLMDQNLPRIRSEDHGIEEIKQKAWCQRVLLVLDDVDNICQLRALAINRGLFRFGSRIVVTTRDLSSISMLEVDEKYEAYGLNEKESLQLFSWHAFRKDHPLEDYDNLSKEVVDYAQGLPLVLESLGSFLSEKTIPEWTSQLKKLKKIPHHDIQKKLRLSYDSLDDEQKDLFLDIACFFVGMDQDLSIKILEACGFFPESGIGVLSRRCLVRIDGHNRLMMHDMIQAMGRDIVRQESPQEPGERSRLWYHEDILGVLRNNTETKAIQGIALNLSKSVPRQVNAEAFTEMKRLRLLHLNSSAGIYLSGSCKHFSRRLVWLSWKGFPLECMPSTLIMDNMVAIDLSYSRFLQVWRESKHVSTLRYLNLRGCSSLVEFDVSGMKGLENLILSDCSKLKELPQDMGSMSSLKELLLDRTAIEKLPKSILRLTKLERLSLDNCQSLKQLPICIGKLSSLNELSLNGSGLEEIPNSIGLLGKLDVLSLMWCKSLTVIPNSVGNLKSLRKFWLNGSSVKELPASVGSLSYLKDLSVGDCHSLSSLPSSIEGLTSVIELQLDGTSILNLPDQICVLKSLDSLSMRNCRSLCSLPKSIGSIVTLTTLIIVNAAITELPESMGMLENLRMLNLNECKKLCKLPASIGELKSLHHLYIKETALRDFPENFGMLTSLVELKMAKKPYQEVPQNAENREPVVLPSTFSNLSRLIEFDARGWKLSGKIPDDFGKLSSLEILNLGHNDFSSLPSSMRALSALKNLFLPHCKELKFLPPLPSSLVEINAANCTALEGISNLSSLESLQELYLTNCEKLVDVPGLESLKSLRRLCMSGCSSCSSALKGKFDKVALKKFYNLSFPGSTIPDWFTQGVAHFSTRKNRVIRSVIICVVVSLNHQTPNDLRVQLPVIPDVVVKILRLNEPLYVSTLYLAGVPKTHEDQVYVCRFPDYNPLVSILKGGDEILVEMRKPPYLKGVELKKCGIYLVYDNDDYDGDEESLDESDDDYDRDEESLDESQQSVSAPANHRNYFLLLFVILSCFFVMLSWLVFNYII